MEFVDNYMKLITGEHRDKPKYMAMVKALLSHSTDIFSVGIEIDDDFDLDFASGNQEDVLGEIVGEIRNLGWQPDLEISPILDNSAFRTLLKAKIAKNMWTGGIRDLAETWRMLFDSDITIRDNQDMTIDVSIVGDSLDAITKMLIKRGDLIPKPQSVLINYHLSQSKVFGYDTDDDVITGYDNGTWN